MMKRGLSRTGCERSYRGLQRRATPTNRLRWVILLSTTLTLTSCSLKRQEVLTTPTEPRRTEAVACQARGRVIATFEHSEVRADFVISYRRDLNRSEIIFRGPLGQNLAKVELSKAASYWIDDNGRMNLKKAPSSARIFSGQWPKLLDFIFGIVTRDAMSLIRLNDQGHPAQLSHKNLMAECRYSTGPFASTCEIRSEEQAVTFVFSSVECRDSLS